MNDQIRCPICGSPNLWDNRTSKRNPRQPDYKCKDKTCDGAIWLDSKRPPKGGSVPMSQPRAVQQQHNANSYDDRSNRIERQHSQEMMLRHLAIRAQVEGPNFSMPGTKELRELISWYQRDIGVSPQLPKSIDVEEDVPQYEEDVAFPSERPF